MCPWKVQDEAELRGTCLHWHGEAAFPGVGQPNGERQAPPGPEGSKGKLLMLRHKQFGTVNNDKPSVPGFPTDSNLGA